MRDTPELSIISDKHIDSAAIWATSGYTGRPKRLFFLSSLLFIYDEMGIGIEFHFDRAQYKRYGAEKLHLPFDQLRAALNLHVGHLLKKCQLIPEPCLYI